MSNIPQSLTLSLSDLRALVNPPRGRRGRSRGRGRGRGRGASNGFGRNDFPRARSASGSRSGSRSRGKITGTEFEGFDPTHLRKDGTTSVLGHNSSFIHHQPRAKVPGTKFNKVLIPWSAKWTEVRVLGSGSNRTVEATCKYNITDSTAGLGNSLARMTLTGGEDNTRA